MKKLFFNLLIAVFFLGCSSNNDIKSNDDNYLIFGHFYGLCFGEGCIEVFKLTKDKLYEDTNDNYSMSSFNFEALNNDKFESVKGLTNSFPIKLLSEKEAVFGCPDCADGGGLYLEYSKNGITKSWRIDQVKQNVPQYLHDFMDAVNDKISLINN